jgi:hypothetical protein
MLNRKTSIQNARTKSLGGVVWGMGVVIATMIGLTLGSGALEVMIIEMERYANRDASNFRAVKPSHKTHNGAHPLLFGERS